MLVSLWMCPSWRHLDGKRRFRKWLVDDEQLMISSSVGVEIIQKLASRSRFGMSWMADVGSG